MTEATGSGGGRTEMERKLVQRSLEDESFRQRLLEDPKGVVEEELGTRLSEGVQVRAVEETADTIYLVLPPRAETEQSSAEISDEELEAVAGGGFDTIYNSDCGLRHDGKAVWAGGPLRRGVRRRGDREGVRGNPEDHACLLEVLFTQLRGRGFSAKFALTAFSRKLRQIL